MSSTLGNNPGIEEFLGHIQKRPTNEVLVERFLVLIMETQADIRFRAMTRLTHILANESHSALQSCYRFLQNSRRIGASVDDEIVALELTKNCFEKLGKKPQVTVIRNEIDKLRARQGASIMKTVVDVLPKAAPVDDNQDSFHRDLRTALHTPKEQTEQISYEDLSAELFSRLQMALGNFTNIRNQQLAIQSLIKAYQLVYEDMGPSIRKALHLYGRNPMLWTLEGEFRPDLRQYFLEGRLFSMGADGLTEGRLRICMELMTGWFDQRLLLPQQSKGKGKELVAQIEFLETALTAIIDRNFG